MDGWILFCGPPTTTLPMGQFCRVRIRNGVRVLGTLRRGYKPGRHNISGPAGMLTDADVEWVQPVLAIRT